jgi:hypothetical protein
MNIRGYAAGVQRRPREGAAKCMVAQSGDACLGISLRAFVNHSSWISLVNFSRPFTTSASIDDAKQSTKKKRLTMFSINSQMFVCLGVAKAAQIVVDVLSDEGTECV